MCFEWEMAGGPSCPTPFGDCYYSGILPEPFDQCENQDGGPRDPCVEDGNFDWQLEYQSNDCSDEMP